MSAEDRRYMLQALDLARRAADDGEVPVGCVVVVDGRVVGRGWNQVERLVEPTAHAEMIAISAAAATLGYSRLAGAVVYVTLEPCLMCAGALFLARIERLVFGSPEPKFGAFGSRLAVQEVEGLNHRFEITSGLFAEESAQLLRAFFREVRRDPR